MNTTALPTTAADHLAKHPGDRLGAALAEIGSPLPIVVIDTTPPSADEAIARARAARANGESTVFIMGSGRVSVERILADAPSLDVCPIHGEGCEAWA